MKITIGFSRPKSGFTPFAKVIMWYQGTDYSHAYIKFDAPSLERTLVYQASSTMVNFIGSERFDAIEILVAEYELEIDDCRKKALLQFFVDKAGTPYGVMQCLGLIIYKKFGWKIFKNEDAEMVCSELVARVLHGLDVPETFYEFDYVTPKDVRDMIDNNPIFKRTV